MRIFRSPWLKWFILAFLGGVSTAAHAEVAISMRYFKTEGGSHYHLFLYSDGGKLIRQLTAPEDAQDTAPMFSADGREIYFTREQRGTRQLFSIRRNGAQLQVVEKAPAGYPPPKDEAHLPGGGGKDDSPWQARGEEYFLKTPDGKQEVILRNEDNFQHLDPAFGGICFKALTIREAGSGQEKRVFTAGEKADNYCDFAMRAKSPFLMVPGLKIAFYWQWQGSTAGPRLAALDLVSKRAVFLSQNPGIAIPHGTRAGFFCVSEDRYQPLGDTGQTVDCSYLDWWDAKLQRTRFAKGISLFGGASVRLEGQPPLDIRGK